MQTSSDESTIPSTSSPMTVLLRGLRKRCPRCGQGNLFHRWTEMADACPRCGLHFEQEEGYWVGALTISTTLSLVLGVVIIGVVMLATWPDLPVLPLTIGGVLGFLIFPILYYPYSKTLWVAIDLVYFNPWRMQPGTGLRRSR